MIASLFRILPLFIIMLVVGIIAFVKGFRWLSRKRLIENTPTSKVRSLAMGLVEVFGEAVPWKEKLEAPLSSKDCVYYKYLIEEYKSSGKSGHWVVIDRGESQSPFFLKDETGMVLIDPKDADIAMSSDVKIESSKDPPKNIKLFLSSRGLKYEGFLGINKHMRYQEWHLAPGDELYIMGTAEDYPSKDIIAKRGTANMIIRKGKYEKFYYISDRPEKTVLKSLHRRVLGSIIGGGSLIIAATILLLFIFAL